MVSSMKSFPMIIAGVGLMAALLGGAPAALAGGDATPVLVELFTSQGCSSCPPADEYIGVLRRRDDVVALSLHVNYWDYIGWRDPYASDVTTERQRAYGRRLSRGQVYTPQMVIDGMAHAVGSDRDAVEAAIRDARGANRPRLLIELEQDEDGGLGVSLPGGHFEGKATVWLVRYDAVVATDVARGENAGRTINNYNVVRGMWPIGEWTGLPLEIRLPATALTSGEGGRDGCVVIVQVAGQGRVLGARALVLAAD